MRARNLALVAGAAWLLVAGAAVASEGVTRPVIAQGDVVPVPRNTSRLSVPPLPESCGQPLPELYQGSLPGAAEPVTEIHGVTLPAVIRSAPATLPEGARPKGGKATTQVMVVVCKDGSVGYVQPMRSASGQVAAAAQEAAAKWKFRPASKDGQPVAVKYAVQVEFTPGS
jgi:hypothetical protein